MAELRRPRSVSQAFLLSALRAQLAGLGTGAPRPLDIVDLGGGTGGIAIALGGDGHRVTVIDPSPDALASLERRTADAGLAGQVVGRQGDATDLVGLVGAGQVDVVLCHRVLEVVDSPADALAAIAEVLRPGGALSLLVAQRHAAVLSQALAGHIALARRTYADRSRFDHDGVIRLVTEAGFQVVVSHGIGAIADQVPDGLIDGEAGAYAELVALEQEISTDPAFRAVAPQVQVFAQVVRPVGAG